MTSLQGPDQEEGPSSKFPRCKNFPSPEPQHDIPNLVWPAPMNAKERAAVSPDAAVNACYCGGWGFIITLGYSRQKNKSQSPPNLISPLPGLSAGSQHGWEGSDICRRFYIAGRCLTLSPSRLLKQSVFERAERAEKQIRLDCVNYRKHGNSVKVSEGRGFIFSSQRYARVSARALVI